MMISFDVRWVLVVFHVAMAVGCVAMMYALADDGDASAFWFAPLAGIFASTAYFLVP